MKPEIKISIFFIEKSIDLCLKKLIFFNCLHSSFVINRVKTKKNIIKVISFPFSLFSKKPSNSTVADDFFRMGQF